MEKFLLIFLVETYQSHTSANQQHTSNSQKDNPNLEKTYKK